MQKYPSTPSFSLKGKKALVVGASSGIGLGAAIALAEYGAKVFLAARNIEKLKDVKSYIETKGSSAEIVSLDLTRTSETSEKIEKLGPFDILLNSAGQARHTKATETVPADFDAVINVNLKGAYFLTQAVAKGLIIAQKPGSLINISSQMAHVGGIDRAVYCASKFAVDAISQSMRIDLNHKNIKVSQVNPGLVNTEFSKVRFKNDLGKAENVYKGMDPLIADDVADVISFIMNRSDNVNISDITILPKSQASSTVVKRD